MTLSIRRLHGVERLSGPLLVVRAAPGIALGEDVRVAGTEGAPRHGQVVELHEDLAGRPGL